MMMPPWCNRWLLAAIMLSMSLHFMILEVDFLAVRSRSTSTRVPCQSCFIVFPAKSSIKGEFLKSEMRFVNNLSFNKSAFQLPTYTDKLHCPHSPATPCCCSNRSILLARRAHSSKPAAAGLLQTDGQTPYRFVDSVPHTMRACANRPNRFW